jgi:hypothetical protein
MKRVCRSVAAAGTASLLCLFAAVASTALAANAAVQSPAAGVKGDPQPELKPFELGNADSSIGSIALEPTGSIVAAWDIPSGTAGKMLVCQLARGTKACSAKAELAVPAGLSVGTGDGPHVLITSPDHVVLLADSCCDGNHNGDTLFYSSTNGGKTFGAPVRIGNVGTSSAVLIGKQIVFIGGDFPDGMQVESIPLDPTGPPASVATVTKSQSLETGVSSYHGGVLAGYDILTKTDTTFVDYAPSGDDFNSSSSYRKVFSIKNEELLAMSGSALLTVQETGKKNMVLRYFDGTSFGPAHVVPGTAGCVLGCAATIDLDPGGVTHFFSETNHSTPLYDLFEYSTSNGTHWSSPVDLGNAISSNSFSAALDANGSGVVLGTGGNQSWGYPVLETQAVSFKLKSSAIRKGKSTTGSGKGSPAGLGRLVTLQVERSGKWYNAATTHEKSGGSFSFTIKGASAGSFTYRAVVSDLAGYLQFGYSASSTLRVNS